MANQEHLDLLKQGSSAWNAWRAQHKEVLPDLSGADLFLAFLSGANLRGARLYKADLSEANLSEATLSEATLSGATLSGATLSGAGLYKANLSGANLNGLDLSGVFLSEANLSGANLSGANLIRANLSGLDLYKADLSEANLSGLDLSRKDFSLANLSGANLSGANLTRAILVKTNLESANLTGCRIYGIAAWNLRLRDTIQSNLIITSEYEPTITVDNLEVAQFIYLLLNNAKIRDVIDAITSKVVLILGRFTPERKVILDALRDELRKRNYLPVVFDFEKPVSRDITETISTLAHMARFVIADLTDPSSIPQELQAIVPTLAVPVQPVLLEGKGEYSMFSDFLKTYHWVLPVYYYRDQGNLLATLKEQVIEPAEQKAKELEKR